MGGGGRGQVMANALEVEDGYTTGALELSIQGPLDKGSAFDRVMRDASPAGLKVRQL